MPSPPSGVEIIKADALTVDNQSNVFKDTKAIYQCSQPTYHRWKEDFPKLQDAILRVAIENKTKLIAVENLYMYGNMHGKLMTEDTPYLLREGTSKIGNKQYFV